MQEPLLPVIVEHCLGIDAAARDIYRALDAQAADARLGHFWLELSRDEDQHLKFWERLLAEVRRGRVPNVFDRPEKILHVLEELHAKAAALNGHVPGGADITAQFMLAYQLEFYLLHPAFAALFHVTKKYTGRISPEREYEEHIDKLLEALTRIKRATPEFRLLSQFIGKIWQDNRAAARIIGDVKTVNGLIPICSGCKKVINYAGYWETIEYYVRKQPDVSLTHWICPECLEKLYAGEFNLKKCCRQ